MASATTYPTLVAQTPRNAPISSTSSTSSIDSINSGRLKTNEEITDEMCLEFSKFLTLNTEKEGKKFNDTVEIMLAKLEEFFSLVDMIRSDTTLCLSTTIPAIQKKCSEIDNIFEKIDKLEELVSRVQECVVATEESVTKAEADCGSGGLVKRLTSFNFLKKPVGPVPAQKVDYEPVEIFSTEQFFVEEKNTSQVTSSHESSESPDIQAT